MWFFAVASGADLVRDEVDARYFFDHRRSDLATDWFRAQMDAHPDDPRMLLGYLRTLGLHPKLRHHALLESVQRWVEQHPEAGEGAVLLAHAVGLEAIEPFMWSNQPWPRTAGSWCEPALGYLSVLPEDPLLRYRQLSLRVQVSQICQQDFAADEAALEELGLSGAAGPFARAWTGLGDEDASGDREAVLAALEREPWRLSDLRSYAAREDTSELLLEFARAAATADKPVLVYGAALVFERAELKEEALAAYRRVAELDPEHPSVQRWIAGLLDPNHLDSNQEAGPEEPEATTVLDPATRLQRLLEQPRPKDPFDAATYWQSMADAAHDLGDVELQEKALRVLARPSWDDRGDVQLVRLAIERGQSSRRARRVADALVEDRRVTGRPRIAQADPGQEWRESLAEALDLRGQLHALRGAIEPARRDLEEALALAGPSATRQLELGKIYAQMDEPEDALGQLAAGLALTGKELDAMPQQREQLQALLAETSWWAPDLDVLVEAAVVEEEEETERALDSTRFAELQVTVDGESVRLFDLPGALVVDVWATWCGPCKESLPHLDQLARTYEGQVTFVALSVDDDVALPGRYLKARGGGSFVAAHVADGMKALGISGIPAVFVFDANHELVANLSGWSPGDRRLDELILELVP